MLTSILTIIILISINVEKISPEAVFKQKFQNSIFSKMCLKTVNMIGFKNRYRILFFLM